MLFGCLSFTIIIYTSLAIKIPLIKTSLGEIEGYHKKSYNGRTYSAFEGIPYAKPPTSNLRFEEAVPGEPWLGRWNASTTYICAQVNPLSNEPIGQEDCLYLNVYVPNTTPTPTDNLDVIVHIHGGAFNAGGPTIGGPKYIMDKNVVYVNMNYRLGAFGFLSTEDEIVPGNNGLKDQAAALKWIQNHITNFGGNPNSVTITGLSAGGASVHLHYFSKNSKGLFHRGISNSGNALMASATQRGALERTKKLSALLGCDNVSIRVSIDCMKQKSTKQIIEKLAYFSSSAPAFPLVLFGPVVEVKSENAFLEDYPFNLLKNKQFNDVPWINTICQNEGILGLFMIKDDLDNAENLWNERSQYYMDYNYTVCEEDKVEVAKKIKEYYFGNNQISLETAEEIISVFGDRYFATSFEKSARMQAIYSQSHVYTYIYNYLNSFAGILNGIFNVSKNYGVGHAENGQLMYDYAFQEFSLGNVNLTVTDELMKDLLLNIMISFARTGVPTLSVDWDPVTHAENFSYLYIENPDKIEMITKKEVTSTEFWDNLPLRENEKLNEQCKEE